MHLFNWLAPHLLNFIWGKMRTAAQETATQIALRSCSKEEGDICDFGEGEILAIKHLFFPITFLLVL